MKHVIYMMNFDVVEIKSDKTSENFVVLTSTKAIIIILSICFLYKII